MGRTKKYEREDIARKAMQVFWRHGYDGTSSQMLVEGMGVNRFSLYAEFGSKQALYVAALAMYEAEVVERNMSALEAPDAGLDSIANLLAGFAAWAWQPDSVLGCFICNTATERAPDDPACQDFVNRYIARLQAGFSRCLQQADRQEMLQKPVDVGAQAQFLATALLGLLVQIRAQVPASMVQASVVAIIHYLHRLTVPGRWQPPSGLQVELA
jgi:TetR/AcrR family transcriptional repressor of nem operon